MTARLIKQFIFGMLIWTVLVQEGESKANKLTTEDLGASQSYSNERTYRYSQNSPSRQIGNNNNYQVSGTYSRRHYKNSGSYVNNAQGQSGQYQRRDYQDSGKFSLSSQKNSGAHHQKNYEDSGTYQVGHQRSSGTYLQKNYENRFTYTDGEQDSQSNYQAPKTYPYENPRPYVATGNNRETSGDSYGDNGAYSEATYSSTEPYGNPESDNSGFGKYSGTSYTQNRNTSSVQDRQYKIHRTFSNNRREIPVYDDKGGYFEDTTYQKSGRRSGGFVTNNAYYTGIINSEDYNGPKVKYSSGSNTGQQRQSRYSNAERRYGRQ